MTETTIQSPRHKSDQWQPADYRDQTQPSVAFRLTVILFFLVWLVGTAWIVAGAETVGSPDEAANNYFMSVVASTGQYRLDSGVTSEALEYLHPRSMAVQGQYLASGSFLGLVQAGALVMTMFGTGAEKFLTPLLSLGGLTAMFFVFRRFWGRWWSLLGVGLIALHPAFFEFSTLPYMHNGAFTAGLMIACLATLRLLERPSWWTSCVAGAACGLALFFRPIEALWIVPALTVLLLARRLWFQLLIVGLVIIVIQLPWLLTNRSVYGSFFSSGYTPGGLFTDVVDTEITAPPIQRLFTPLGGWSWHWLSSVWWYFVLLVPVWSAMALIAISRYFRRKYVSLSKSLKLTVISLIGLFPLVYYGSWNLYPTTPASDIGALASYVRYWIPLYVLMAPGVIMTLRLISRRWIVLAVVSVMIVTQAFAIWAHPVSGLQARFAADKKNTNIRQQVVMATEPNAVLIAGHADKYFQDQRLSGFRLPKNEREWRVLRALIDNRPVYLYVAVGAVNTSAAQTTMSTYGLRMDQRLTIGRDQLWKISAQL